MTNEVIVALVAGAASIIAVIITNISSNRKIQHKLEIGQAITSTEIKELTREVREHNNFARRMPVVEEQIKVANHRIEDLENKKLEGKKP